MVHDTVTMTQPKNQLKQASKYMENIDMQALLTNTSTGIRMCTICHSKSKLLLPRLFELWQSECVETLRQTSRQTGGQTDR